MNSIMKTFVKEERLRSLCLLVVALLAIHLLVMVIILPLLSSSTSIYPSAEAVPQSLYAEQSADLLQSSPCRGVAPGQAGSWQPVFIVVVIASLSSTSVHTFSFLRCCIDNKFLLQKEDIWSVDDTLANYAINSRKLHMLHIPLIKHAAYSVPRRFRKHTPLLFRANASLRKVISKRQFKRLMRRTKLLLKRFPFYVKTSHMTIMEEREEVADKWMSGAFLTGRLYSASPSALAIADLAGGKLQVAFSISPPSISPSRATSTESKNEDLVMDWDPPLTEASIDAKKSPPSPYGNGPSLLETGNENPLSYSKNMKSFESPTKSDNGGDPLKGESHLKDFNKLNGKDFIGHILLTAKGKGFWNEVGQPFKPDSRDPRFLEKDDKSFKNVKPPLVLHHREDYNHSSDDVQVERQSLQPNNSYFVHERDRHSSQEREYLHLQKRETFYSKENEPLYSKTKRETIHLQNIESLYSKESVSLHSQERESLYSKERKYRHTQDREHSYQGKRHSLRAIERDYLYFAEQEGNDSQNSFREDRKKIDSSLQTGRDNGQKLKYKFPKQISPNTKFGPVFHAFQMNLVSKSALSNSITIIPGRLSPPTDIYSEGGKDVTQEPKKYSLVARKSRKKTEKWHDTFESKNSQKNVPKILRKKRVVRGPLNGDKNGNISSDICASCWQNGNLNQSVVLPSDPEGANGKKWSNDKKRPNDNKKPNGNTVDCPTPAFYSQTNGNATLHLVSSKSIQRILSPNERINSYTSPTKAITSPQRIHRKRGRRKILGDYTQNRKEVTRKPQRSRREGELREEKRPRNNIVRKLLPNYPSSTKVLRKFRSRQIQKGNEAARKFKDFGMHKFTKNLMRTKFKSKENLTDNLIHPHGKEIKNGQLLNNSWINLGKFTLGKERFLPYTNFSGTFSSKQNLKVSLRRNKISGVIKENYFKRFRRKNIQRSTKFLGGLRTPKIELNLEKYIKMNNSPPDGDMNHFQNSPPHGVIENVQISHHDEMHNFQNSPHRNAQLTTTKVPIKVLNENIKRPLQKSAQSLMDIGVETSLTNGSQTAKSTIKVPLQNSTATSGSSPNISLYDESTISSRPKSEPVPPQWTHERKSPNRAGRRKRKKRNKPYRREERKKGSMNITSRCSPTQRFWLVAISIPTGIYPARVAVLLGKNISLLSTHTERKRVPLSSLPRRSDISPEEQYKEDWTHFISSKMFPVLSTSLPTPEPKGPGPPAYPHTSPVPPSEVSPVWTRDTLNKVTNVVDSILRAIGSSRNELPPLSKKRSNIEGRGVVKQTIGRPKEERRIGEPKEGTRIGGMKEEGRIGVLKEERRMRGLKKKRRMGELKENGRMRLKKGRRIGGLKEKRRIKRPKEKRRIGRPKERWRIGRQREEKEGRIQEILPTQLPIPSSLSDSRKGNDTTLVGKFSGEFKKKRIPKRKNPQSNRREIPTSFHAKDIASVAASINPELHSNTSYFKRRKRRHITKNSREDTLHGNPVINKTHGDYLVDKFGNDSYTYDIDRYAQIEGNATYDIYRYAQTEDNATYTGRFKLDSHRRQSCNNSRIDTVNGDSQSHSNVLRGKTDCDPDFKNNSSQIGRNSSIDKMQRGRHLIFVGRKNEGSESQANNRSSRKRTISSVTDLLFTVPNVRIIQPRVNSAIDSEIKSTEKIVRDSLTEILRKVPSNIMPDTSRLDDDSPKKPFPSLIGLAKEREPLSVPLIKRLDELVLRSPCIPKDSEGRFTLNGATYVVSRANVTNEVEECWKDVCEFVEKYVHVPSLEGMNLLANGAFYFIATSVNLLDRSSPYGYVRAGNFKMAAQQVCEVEVNRLADPLACLDYQFVAALILRGFKIDPEARILVTESIGEFRISSALGAALTYLQKN